MTKQSPAERSGEGMLSGHDRALFDYAPDGILIADSQGQYLDANPSVCRMLGYEREELVGRNAQDIVAASEFAHIDPALDLIKTRRHYQREWLFKRRDGSTFPAEVMVTTMPDGNLLALVRDTTERRERERAHEERRKAEEAAQQEKVFSAAVLDSMPGILYLYDEQGRFLRWNRNFETFSGYSGPEIARMHPLDFFSDQVKGLVGQRIKEVFESGEAIVEAPFLAKNGRQVPYLFTGRRIVFDGVSCLVGMGIDISRRKAAELALSESEAEFKTLTEAMPQMVWIAHSDGRTAYLSQQWTDYTGLTSDEILRQGWGNAIHPDDREKARAAWQEATATLSAQTVECRLLRGDGGYRWWLIRGVPLRTGNRVLKWVGTCTDINDLKLAGLEVARVNRALAMLSGCNEAVVRATEEESLLQDVCRIAVEVGGYRMGRVYVPSAGAQGDVLVRAHAGAMPDSLRALAAAWKPDRPEGPGPITRVLASGQALVVADMLEEPSLEQVAREIEECGIRGGIYLPLLVEGRAFGVLALYSADALQVRGEELRLLNSLANDLAFGIGVLGARVERENASLALRDTLREKEVLLKEVHHRVKNNMQVIISLLRLEGSRADHSRTRNVLEGMMNRIQSMALLHESLYRSSDLARIDLGGYLERITQHLMRSQTTPGLVQIRSNLISVDLDMDHAIPCGLLVNELVSNSLKHAFADGRPGVVQLELGRIEEGNLQLRVSDDGMGFPPDFEARRTGSLGLQLVSDLTRQLGGRLDIGADSSFTVTFSPNPGGAGSRLQGIDSGPLDRRAASSHSSPEAR